MFESWKESSLPAKLATIFALVSVLGFGLCTAGFMVPVDGKAGDAARIVAAVCGLCCLSSLVLLVFTFGWMFVTSLTRKDRD